MHTLLLAASCATGLLTVTTAPTRATLAVTNINNPDPTGYTFPSVACSFTTGDQPAVLNSISLPYWSTSSMGMDLTAQLFSDAGDRPATVLEQFPEQTGPEGHGTATFPSAGTLLAPHTTYWFYLYEVTNTYWATTSLTSETSGYGWTIGDQAYYGYYVPGAGRFSVDVTFVPEPAAVSLLVLPALALFPRRRHHNSENRR